MPSLTQTLVLASMASLSLAMTVTSPTKYQLWDSAKSNTISWSSVPTDPQTVDIYLAHMAANPPLNTLLFSSISTSTSRIDVSGLQLPTGETYQINLVAHGNEQQILAQSQQFNVTGEAVQATSTLDGYTGPTYSPTASGSPSITATQSLTTLTRTSTDASGSATTDISTSTATSDDAESTDSSSTDSSASSTSTDEAPSQTIAAANGTASTTAKSTPNAAVANIAASGSLAALFFGVAAFLV